MRSVPVCFTINCKCLMFYVLFHRRLAAGCGVCQAAGNGLAGVRVWRAGCLWWLRGLGRVGVVGGFIVVFLRVWVNVY